MIQHRAIHRHPIDLNRTITISWSKLHNLCMRSRFLTSISINDKLTPSPLNRLKEVSIESIFTLLLYELINLLTVSLGILDNQATIMLTRSHTTYGERRERSGEQILRLIIRASMLSLNEEHTIFILWKEIRPRRWTIEDICTRIEHHLRGIKSF